MHDFNASNRPGTCLWCGRKLKSMTRPQTHTSIIRGETKTTTYPSRDPNPWPGLFDTRGCAEMFGARFAQLGHRLSRRPASGELPARALTKEPTE